MLLIGSLALVNRGLQLSRPISDVDYICTFEEYEKHSKELAQDVEVLAHYPLDGSHIVMKTSLGTVEYEIAWDGSSLDLWNKYGLGQKTASINDLYMLKMSHRYKKNSPHFLKTMSDIRLLRSHGAVIEDQDLYEKRMKETYNYAHPKLNQNKDGFFKDDVPYQYDHDSIHEAVKTLKKPAYRYFMKDEAEVQTSKAKFFAQTREIQLLAGLEESYVLALERSQIPHPGVWTPKRSFDYALMKVCTSITSGYFREFCWENYDAIQAMYLDNYVDRFKAGLLSGVVKPFVREMV